MPASIFDETNIDALTSLVIGCAFKVHTTLGAGFLESVYKNALIHELSTHPVTVEPEAALTVSYSGVVVGSFYADLIIDHRLIIELKAVEKLTMLHEIQLVNYLNATGIQDGLLINFGNSKVEVRHKYSSRLKN